MIESNDISQGDGNSQPPNISNHPLASVLSMIGGIVVTIGGVLGTIFEFTGASYAYDEMMGGYGGFIGGMIDGHYRGYAYFVPAYFDLTILGLVAGVVVIVVALYMRNLPAGSARTAGLIILMFSIIGALTIGGLFLIGGAFGIMGGGLALLLK